jgi:hypothetical protein
MKIPGRLPRAAITVAAATLAASGVFGGVASAANSTPAASPPHPIPYPGTGTSSQVPPLPVPQAAAGCTPFAQGDYAHVSSGDVSAHGWWTIGDGGCPNEKASVTVGLQEYFSDLTWHNEGTVGTSSVYPGGGSANRAAARATCAATTPIAGWRSYVIVKIGNGASAYTAAQNIACRT